MKRLFQWSLYALCPIFVIWLYGISNVFTMGYYTPLPRKIVLSTVAIMLPLTLLVQRRSVAAILALIFALATWPALILLWILDRRPYGI